MLFSEGTGHKVVSTSTAETVGKVAEFVVDPKIHAVLAVELKKTDHGDTLRWADLTFGVDAVTVSGADKITAADEEIDALSGKHHRILGKRVLTTFGDEIGEVSDVDFDPDTGVISSLVLGDDTVAGVRLIGVGSYAVVVQPA